MITYLGALTIGDVIPLAAQAGANGVLGINLAIPDIQARLAALASFAPTPSDFGVDVAIAQGIVASLEAAIAVGVSPPSISAQLAIVAGLVADLRAALDAINVHLSIVTDFLALLETGGVFAYRFNGAANALGGEFATELSAGFPGGGATDTTDALLFATTTPDTWTAMSAVFRIAP